MPSITGYATEDQLEEIDNQVERGDFDDRSDFVQEALSYYFYHRVNR